MVIEARMSLAFLKKTEFRGDSQGVQSMNRASISRRQERKQKSYLQRDMCLALVSHELRTPTNAIVGWAQLIKSGYADEKTLAQGIDVIERNARLQAELIEQLLDFSRVSNGLLRLDAQIISLGPVLEAAAATMLPQALASGIHLSVHLDESTYEVIGDPLRLHQVVTNLLANAVKFTPAGGAVTIRLARRRAHAEITVSDTGRGISADFLPNIFEPFGQAAGNKATATDGLGLGLAIARHIIESHKGKINAESPGEGKGTKLTVTLPLLEETASDKRTP
jgi:signal transduction histidine kinase